jgi:hypothetical protein
MAPPLKGMTFDLHELTVIIDALALAASRRESQARAVKHGRHHDLAAAKMRLLRARFVQRRFAQTTQLEDPIQ